jgi:PKD repeat protein
MKNLFTKKTTRTLILFAIVMFMISGLSGEIYADFSLNGKEEKSFLSFAQEQIVFKGYQGQSLPPIKVNLSSSQSTSNIILSDDPDSSEWLILPSSVGLGEVEFGAETNLPPGIYSTTVFAIDGDGINETSQIEILLEIQPEIQSGKDFLTFNLDVAVSKPVIKKNEGRIEILVSYGTDITSLRPIFTVSEGAIASPASGTFIDFSFPVTFTVVGQDGTSKNWVAIISEDDESVCSSISPFACDGLSVTFPFKLEFNGDEGGLGNTGFRMVDYPSNRIEIDGPISFDNVPGYEPERLSFSDGNLIIDASNGIAFRTNASTNTDLNSQLNALGVGMNLFNSPNIDIRTTLVNPTSGTNNGEQAGIWFGLDEDNYVKLVVSSSNRIQLLREINGVSVNRIDDNILVTNIAGLHQSEVGLRLKVDIERNLLIGYYNLNGGEDIEIGALVLPFNFISGNPAYQNLSFAGIFATKRRQYNAQVLYAFSDFSITSDAIPDLDFEPVRINFSRTIDQIPDGFLKDGGEPFGVRGNGYSYGWLATDAKTPINLTGNTRNRFYDNLGPIQNTLVHMQYGDANGKNGNIAEGIWKINVPNGNYQVVVGVGDGLVDGAITNPSHTINVNGINVIKDFVPVGTQGTPSRFTTGSVPITVTDEKIIVDAIGGFNTKLNSVNIFQLTQSEVPYLTSPLPFDNSINVKLENLQVTVSIITPDGYEIDKSTISGNVNLYEVIGNSEILVPSNSNDSGGGDAITLTPIDFLKEKTTYIFRTTSGIEANRTGDLSDRIPFLPFSSKFTTGDFKNDFVSQRDLSNVEFIRVQGGADLGEGTFGERFSSLAIGPDGKLYGSTIGDFQSDGKIFRWNIEPDGTLTNLEILSPELTGSPHPINGPRDNQNRLIIGFEFDPNSTEDNLVAYVTHSQAALTNGPAWDGKITKLTGPDLNVVQDLVIHLPRSTKDHLLNSITFDLDGKMYLGQGSNSAGGQPDPAWNNRPESLLAGAVLKLDLNKLPANLPLSVFTTDDISIINSAPSSGLTMSDGTYNPYSADSPLTVFASGVRNAYDLVWHSNGWLYVPINGTAGNNSTAPNSPSTLSYPLARRMDGRTNIPFAPALFGGESQKDWLAKTKGGSYHGHPNPYRGEFVLNHGGVPYSGIPGQLEISHRDVAKYPTDLLPDVNFRSPAFDFGKNKSPNGIIEYKSDAFGGKLQGLIMVVRFSGQNDILVLEPNENGDIGAEYSTIPGLRGFVDPLDLVEDPKTGNIYISEYDRANRGVARLTLLRAGIQASLAPKISAKPQELIFEVTANGEGNTTDTRMIEISNIGNEVLNISSAVFSGEFAGQFSSIEPDGSVAISPGQKLNYSITYSPVLDNTNLGYQQAVLVLNSDSPSQPEFSIGLHALKKRGFEGSEEPTLHEIVQTLGIGIDVGWTSQTTNTNPDPLGEEVLVQQWIKAGPGSVKIKPVGRYSPAELLPFGWYTVKDEVELNQVGVLANGLANAQTLNPPIASGSDNFDPEGEVFGIYVQSQRFGRVNYTQDSLNLISGGEGPVVAHRARVYPMKNRQGDPIANSYFVTFEDASNGDYQDYIFVIENVVPFEKGSLQLSFDKKAESILKIVGDNQPIIQKLILNRTGQLSSNQVTLTSSDPRIVLPDNFTFGAPFDVRFNVNGLAVGIYEGTVSAAASNYPLAEFKFIVSVISQPVYEYQFNFQTPNNVITSPLGYIDDLGSQFGTQTTIKGNLSFGWVVPGTKSPASAALNARNRNTGVNNDPLLKTFSIIGHRSSTQFPIRDWIVELPNGTYFVNVSVGEQGQSDSQHFLDVNGVRVINFDQQNNNVNNLTYFNDTKKIEVRDGIMRLSLAEGGVNAKVNYIRIAPVKKEEQPPFIVAEFSGKLFAEDTYRGPLQILLTAQENSGSSGITRLQFGLNGSPLVDYVESLSFDENGDYSLFVEVEDGNGNISTKTFDFKIEDLTGAVIKVENMTRFPNTQRAFPADDYYSFYRLGERGPNNAQFHDSNIMRISNSGTNDLIVSGLFISDQTEFQYSIISNGIGSDNLPLIIPPGAFRDINIEFIGSTGTTSNGMFKSTIEVITNADNGKISKSILHAGYAPFPEGGREIHAQEVIDLFGFKTSMLSIVNDQGTITPPNPKPENPSSNFPIAENIDLGYEGDMIYSATFVRADPSQPVRGIQLAALHGFSSNGAKFVRVDDVQTVGSVNFSHDAEWYQSILPRSGNNINHRNSNHSGLNSPFRIAIVNYLTSGGNNGAGRRPDLLGVRVYKAIDSKGNVIPYEYIVIQDFIGDGCGAGSANCDWQDNVFYFSNIRPEALPSASQIPSSLVDQDKEFVINVSGFFDKGYPGNKFGFKATLINGNPLPYWLKLNSDGVFVGKAPVSADLNYTFIVEATDSNGIVVSSEMQLNINKAPNAIISSDLIAGRVPLTVNFQGENSNDDSGIVTYSWDFGDGFISEEINPSHTYEAIGEFDVTLRVVDARGLEGVDKIRIKVADINGPLAVATGNILVGQNPLSVQFDASQSNSNVPIVSYFWDFGDGNTSELIKPTHTYTNGGEYIVVLTVLDSEGLVDTFTLNINVSEPIAPNMPNLISPENIAKGVSRQVIFDWQESANAETYWLQVSDDPNFNNLIVDTQGLSETMFTGVNLLPKTPYYWRVMASNAYVSSSWSQIFQFSTVDLESNLAGHWKMDEGSGSILLDHSGFGNNATLKSSNNVSWIDGVIGMAVKLPGNLNRFGIVQHTPSLNISNSITISAWIRPDGNPANRVVLIKGDPNGYRLGIRNNGKVEFSLYNAVDGSNIVMESNSNYPANGTAWTHVTATFDGFRSAIYINGILDNELISPPFQILTSESELFIGANKTEGARWFGDLDDLRLYGRALTDDEISDLYNQPNSNFRIASSLGKFGQSGIEINEMDESLIETDYFSIKTKIYPNPIDEKLNILFADSESSVINIMVFDMMGRKYVEKSVIPEDGKVILDFSGMGMSKGTYNLVIQSESGTYEVFKFLKN